MTEALPDESVARYASWPITTSPITALALEVQEWRRLSGVARGKVASSVVLVEREWRTEHRLRLLAEQLCDELGEAFAEYLDASGLVDVDRYEALLERWRVAKNERET